MPIVNLHYQELLENFLNSPVSPERYDYSFPLAVFGTLRSIPKDQGNMKWFQGIEPCKIEKGFLKNCSPHLIYLNVSIGNYGPFEVYYFDKESFLKMIPSIDTLESFSAKNMRGNYYQRSLVYINLLPERFKEDVFAKGIGDELSLDIDESQEFEKIPCWVYSNKQVNKVLGEDLIWCNNV